MFKNVYRPFGLIALAMFTMYSCKPSDVITDDTQPPLSQEEIQVLEVNQAAEYYLEQRRARKLGDDPVLMRLVQVSDVAVDHSRKEIDIYFNPRFADYPIRPGTVTAADSLIRSVLSDPLRTYTIRMYSMGYDIRTLIPNYFQNSPRDIDFLRRPIGNPSYQPSFVRNLDAPWLGDHGLQNRHIALWHSHGWYYNLSDQRWEWQRPRLFNTTEDMLPMVFTLPYIIPMLEGAGAHVWVPRERDVQRNMVIVDNDGIFGEGEYLEAENTSTSVWTSSASSGFTPSVLPLTDETNPFNAGSSRQTITDGNPTASATWIPDIPESGEYAVYVSYSGGADFTSDARYTVYHTGGSTRFSVNQQMASGTWVYLGHFHFDEGYHPERGSVELINISDQTGRKLSADAVRFGGGEGVIERNGRTSESARFLEGARYHMQFAGAPDSLVWILNENNDYSDDFQGRGEWVNYLRGTPYGPNLSRGAGLGVPIELSLAFHTDAGVTRNDSVIGTLSIYTLGDVDDRPHFPDGMSRMANRDLTDIMQTQIVNDVRVLHDTTWVRRALRNARYSESMRPNVPSTLLELLSHQNFRDMEYAMDPHFRFDVSRASYKSMLRFVADQHGLDYIVQPLPVTHMMSEIADEGVRLRWMPQEDPLEPTASPTGYVLYTKEGDSGFDNGRAIADTTIVLHDLVPGTVYSFRVRAANDGGVSMPSETITVALATSQDKPVLLINGFTRVGTPAVIKEQDFRGFAHFLDAGVADGLELGFSGEQYNYDINDDWVSDDRPGHGASHADFEERLGLGNTRDFARIYVQSLLSAGRSVVTVSEAAIESGLVQPFDYDLVVLMLGKQRQISGVNAYAEERNGLRYGIYASGMQDFLTRHAENGGRMFISGAHVGTDLIHRPVPDSSVIRFARDILGYQHVTNHASRSGQVFGAPLTRYSGDESGKVSSVNDGAAARPGQTTPVPSTRVFLPSGLEFNTRYGSEMYRVDAPDAIEPSGDGGFTLLRYDETEFSAATGYKGRHRVVVFGFPFETILGQADRDEVMREVLKFLMEE